MSDSGQWSQVSGDERRIYVATRVRRASEGAQHELTAALERLSLRGINPVDLADVRRLRESLATTAIEMEHLSHDQNAPVDVRDAAMSHHGDLMTSIVMADQALAAHLPTTV